MSNRHLFTQSLVPPWPVVFLIEIPAPWFIKNDLPGTTKCFLQHIKQHQTIKKNLGLPNVPWCFTKSPWKNAPQKNVHLFGVGDLCHARGSCSQRLGARKHRQDQAGTMEHLTHRVSQTWRRNMEKNMKHSEFLVSWKLSTCLHSNLGLSIGQSSFAELKLLYWDPQAARRESRISANLCSFWTRSVVFKVS